MPDLWSEAIQEARAVAPVDVFELETFEILHPAFVDDDDMPDSVRGVLDERDWELELEADAPLKASQVVTFKAASLEITKPPQEAGAAGTARLSFDNVARAFQPMLDRAIGVRATGTLILRSWLATRNVETGVWSCSGPPGEVMGDLTIREVDITGVSISGTARFWDLLGRGFPGRTMSREDYPGLFGGAVD